MDVVFRRLGFAIQKGLAAQLIARLPLILYKKNVTFIFLFKE
jgi:hypothetical protein